MRLNRFISASFITLLVLVTASSNSFAQRKVLFETFTNSCDPYPDPSRAPFDAAVRSTISSEGSKIIHLDYHVANLCDQASVSDHGGLQVDNRLYPASKPGSYTIYVAGIDRTSLSNGYRSIGVPTGGGDPEWNSDIDNESGTVATLSLVNATLDNIDPTGSLGLIFRADVLVTLNQAISDKLVIRYAIVEDNVTTADDNSGGKVTSPKNDIVRWITNGDSVVFPSGAAAGATKTVSYQQTTLCGSHDPRLIPAKMRFVAFLEEQASATDYQVINAAILKQDLSTLPLPIQKLSLVSDSLDGRTFNPGGALSIFFNAQSVHSLIAYYSPDGGTTWVEISPAAASPLIWNLPDTISPTTQGKIKIVETGGAAIVDIETGMFSIKPRPSLKLLHPIATDTAHAGKHFLIQWTKFKADTVSKINLTLGLGTAKTIATNIADTSYDWIVPDTNIIATLQIVPTKSEQDAGAAAQTSPQFYILKTFGGVSDGLPSLTNTFAIRDVYPNPAQPGGTMTMQYTLAHPAMTTIEVFDVLGHSLQRQSFYSSMNTGEYSFAVGTLAPGSYVLHMTDGEHSASKRIEILR